MKEKSVICKAIWALKKVEKHCISRHCLLFSNLHMCEENNVGCQYAWKYKWHSDEYNNWQVFVKVTYL